MNKSLFPTLIKKTSVAVANKAGGKSYDLSTETALATYAVTCTFNGTYYSTAEDHLKVITGMLDKCKPEFIAKVAVYSAKQGHMKDVPTFLLSYLFANYPEYTERVFNKVIYNAKMLCNFVQLVRSGIHGRKSFGTLGKRLIQDWFAKRTAEQLFKDSVGHSAPTLVDIIKMVHPKFKDESQNNMVKYLMGKKFDARRLPNLVKCFESLKAGKKASPEGLDFRLLSNLSLSTEQWTELGMGMTWNALRMNLNNLQKHGVFNNGETASNIANKLSDPVAVKKFNAFPYQLLTTFQNVAVPQVIKEGIERALEYATENVPNLGRVAVCVDVSGSMQSTVTGNRPGATSKTTCVDVAGLIASCLLRTASECSVIPFDDNVRLTKVSKSDSVLTNSRKLAMSGGGTACSAPMRYLAETHWVGDVVIMVSDNMSWADYASNSGIGWGTPQPGTRFKDAWNKIKGKNGKCKLILIDVTPNHQSQMHEDKNVLHVAGFSDQVFEVIKAFMNDKESFVDVINSVEL